MTGESLSACAVKFSSDKTKLRKVGRALLQESDRDRTARHVTTDDSCSFAFLCHSTAKLFESKQNLAEALKFPHLANPNCDAKVCFLLIRRTRLWRCKTIVSTKLYSNRRNSRDDDEVRQHMERGIGKVKLVNKPAEALEQ
jgi:hypothetical protein